MFKKINFLKSISLIALFIAFFGLAVSAYACNTGDRGFGGGFWGWGGKQHDNKVTICHITHGKTVKYSEMTVNKKDLFLYLKHGDYLGKCVVPKPKPKPEKITICHIPYGNPANAHTITISKSALKIHLLHGDYIGECKPPVTLVCGNGIIDSGEQCDDGNTVNGDGCSATCQIETPAPACGDGNVDSGEQCDDGNTVNGDGCDASCNIEACGNGIIQSGEQCDDDNVLDNDGCSSTCKLEVCGDGVQQANEQCDDGNLIGGDGCDATCQIETPANEIFAQGVLTAITKNGQQTGEADLNFATNTFAKIILNCTTWNACSLQLVRSSGISPYDFSATFDTGTLSSEVCDGNGVCTANSAFVLPTDSADLSMELSFTDTAGASVGDTTISLDPTNDKINVTGTVGVVADTGANMLTIGEAEASAESNAKVTNIATAEDGALVSSSQSLMGAYEHSSGETSNKSVASGAGAVSSSNDIVGANVNGTVNHNVVSNGTGPNAASSCSITSKSQGDSIATLDALGQDGLQTDDSVNHTETLNDPDASVIIHADCGDVQF